MIASACQGLRKNPSRALRSLISNSPVDGFLLRDYREIRSFVWPSRLSQLLFDQETFKLKVPVLEWVSPPAVIQKTAPTIAAEGGFCAAVTGRRSRTSPLPKPLTSRNNHARETPTYRPRNRSRTPYPGSGTAALDNCTSTLNAIRLLSEDERGQLLRAGRKMS
jgi:hypothetical protein